MNETNELDEKDNHVDEDAGILYEVFLKIHDPETGEVQYEGRA